VAYGVYHIVDGVWDTYEVLQLMSVHNEPSKEWSLVVLQDATGPQVKKQKI
jgi:hypothetical protein